MPRLTKVVLGERYGRLTVIGFAKRARGRWAICKCDCGQQKICPCYHLTDGRTKSCGCLSIELGTKRITSPKARAAVALALTKHGLAGTRLYGAWSKMKARCYYTQDSQYKNYGGRGIKVCARWVDSFENFALDMGDPPEGTSLDRIDVNGDYEPLNCRWATVLQQARNKQDTIYVKWRGEKITLKEAAERLNASYEYLWALRRRKALPQDVADYNPGEHTMPLRHRKGAQHPMAKLTVEQVLELRAIQEAKKPGKRSGLSAAAKRLGISFSYAHAIATRKFWKSVK